jgi:hypothetical protein
VSYEALGKQLAQMAADREKLLDVVVRHPEIPLLLMGVEMRVRTVMSARTTIVLVTGPLGADRTARRGGARARFPPRCSSLFCARPHKTKAER